MHNFLGNFMLISNLKSEWISARKPIKNIKKFKKKQIFGRYFALTPLFFNIFKGALQIWIQENDL